MQEVQTAVAAAVFGDTRIQETSVVFTGRFTVHRPGWWTLIFLGVWLSVFVMGAANADVPICEIGNHGQSECEAGEWHYDLDDPQGYNTGHHSRMCEIWQEGTYNGPYGSPVCEGTVDNPFPSEGTFVSKGEQYVESLISSDCQVTSVEGRGWLAPGESFVYNAYETRTPKYEDGVEVYNSKELIFHHSCDDGDSGSYRLAAERSRRLVGYGPWRFYLLEDPDETPCDTCWVGNPIGVSIGNKRQREVDLVDSVGRLDFVRHYSSKPLGSGALEWNGVEVEAGHSHWRHRFSRFVEEVHLGIDPPTDRGFAVSGGWYGSPEAACQQGAAAMSESIDDAMEGDEWSVQYSDSDGCQVVSPAGGGGTGVTPGVRVAVLDGRNEPETLQLVRLHRPDGSVVPFQNRDGQWQPVGYPGASLEAIGGGGWRYESRDGVVEVYNEQGRLTRIVYVGGEFLTLSYHPTQGGMSVTDHRGRTLEMESVDGQLQVTAPGGERVTFSYGANGEIATAEYEDGTLRQYHYEDERFPDALTGITDENGELYASWEYDEEGRAVVSEHTGGAQRTELTFNGDGTTTVTNPLGKETTYHIATIAGLRKPTRVEGHPTPHGIGANSTYTYNANGQLASRTDWNGNTTTYEYNDRGLVIRKVEAAGTPEQRVTTKTWHPEYRLPDVVTKLDRVIDHDYDEQGRLISREIREPQ